MRGLEFSLWRMRDLLSTRAYLTITEALAAILLIAPENTGGDGFAAVCVSLLESRVIGGSGERSSRYKQSRYDQRSEWERERGGGKGRERPLTARLEHISPTRSLFVKLSLPIIQIIQMYFLYLVMLDDVDTSPDSGSPQSRPTSAWGELAELESGAQVSQPTSCFLKVTSGARHHRHRRLSWHVTQCHEDVIGDVDRKREPWSPDDETLTMYEGKWEVRRPVAS